MLTLNTDSAPSIANEHEEFIWMQQLQEPEQVKYQLAVWQVNPYPDLTILHKSIVHLLEIHSDLNVRYHFTDDGDLYKYPDTDFSACIQTEQIQEKQLITLLAQLMQQSWQPETTSPFLVTVISTENKVFLALRLHPILAQQFTLDDLIQEIQATYTSSTGAPHQLELLPLDLTVLNIPATPAQPANTESLPDIILAEFRNTLAEPDMTADDDFFDFGGHSLLATRVIGNLQKNHGIKLNFNDFFKSPTAGALAKIARQQQPAVSAAEVQPDKPPKQRPFQRL